jgi:hypothetical protein
VLISIVFVYEYVYIDCSKELRQQFEHEQLELRRQCSIDVNKNQSDYEQIRQENQQIKDTYDRQVDLFRVAIQIDYCCF